MSEIKKGSVLFIILLVFCTCAIEQKSETVYGIFAKAPISVFDYTTEGISIEEKNDLLNKGESESWKIVSKTDKKIVIDCKYPSSQVILFLLEKQNELPLLVSYTENEKVRNIDIWKLNDKGIVEKVQLLPVVLAKDFFSKENQIHTISDYNSNVYYYFDASTNSIHAGLFVSMERELEGKDIDFNVNLNWNGNSFEVHKSPVAISKQTGLSVKEKLEELQCDKINFKFLTEEENQYLSKIIVQSDSVIIDTVHIQNNKVNSLAVGDFRIRKEDYNFDNVCDFIIEDVMSVYDGNMKRYFYIFDLETKKFKEVKSLQNWIGNVEVDQINKKVILYCAYEECKVSYKFIDGDFKIVEGEYPKEPE